MRQSPTNKQRGAIALNRQGKKQLSVYGNSTWHASKYRINSNKGTSSKLISPAWDLRERTFTLTAGMLWWLSCNHTAQKEHLWLDSCYQRQGSKWCTVLMHYSWNSPPTSSSCEWGWPSKFGSAGCVYSLKLCTFKLWVSLKKVGTVFWSSVLWLQFITPKNQTCTNNHINQTQHGRDLGSSACCQLIYLTFPVTAIFCFWKLLDQMPWKETEDEE